MIIRLVRARIASGRSPDVHALLREHGLPAVIGAPGAVDVYAARRDEGGSEIVVIVTVWRDWTSLTAALGDDPTTPYLLTGESGLVDEVTVEHFEALDLPGRSRGDDRTPGEAAPAVSRVG